jgi:hypothetical protein
VLVKSLLVVVLASAPLVACSSATTGEDEAARRWAREVRILAPGQLGSRPYEVLGGFEERVRIGALGKDDAIREAESKLRLRAAKVDADAVVIGFCDRARDPHDLSTRSTPTVICQGTAIRWTGP